MTDIQMQIGDYMDLHDNLLLANARVQVLEDAIAAHRLACGRAYHNDAFRHMHAANTDLWALITHVQPDENTENEPDSSNVDTGIARPAMMEDDHE